MPNEIYLMEESQANGQGSFLNPQIDVKETQLALLKMDKTLTNVAGVFLAMSEKVNALEAILKTKITITGAQAKTVSDAVVSRARDFCTISNVSYRKAGRIVRRVLWRDFLREFSVSDHHDLPAQQLIFALEYIRGWTSYATAKKLRSLADGKE